MGGRKGVPRFATVIAEGCVGAAVSAGLTFLAREEPGGDGREESVWQSTFREGTHSNPHLTRISYTPNPPQPTSIQNPNPSKQNPQDNPPRYTHLAPPH